MAPNDSFATPEATRPEDAGTLRTAGPVSQAPAGQSPARAFGQSLVDFMGPDTNGALLPAEALLLEACAKGEVCRLESRRTRRWRVYRESAALPGFEELTAELLRRGKGEAQMSDDALEEALERRAAAMSPEMKAVSEEMEAEITARLRDAFPSFDDDTEIPTEMAAEFTAFQHRLGIAMRDEVQPWHSIDEAPADAPFMALIAEAVAVDDARPDDLKSRIDALPAIRRDYLEDVVAFAADHPRLPPEQRKSLATDPSPLRPLIDHVHKRFALEARGWRAVPADDPSIHIRAGFLRLLCLGTDPAIVVHEFGLHVRGAVIVGGLNLNGVTAARTIFLIDCLISDGISLKDAHVRLVQLQGSLIGSLDAERSTLAGGLYVRDGARVSGTLRLTQAHILGDLDCSDATINGDGSFAIRAENLLVDHHIFLYESFATGLIGLAGSRVGGVVNASGGYFRNPASDCLDLRSGTIARDVLIGGETTFSGQVVLDAARIGGSLSCATSYFRRGESTDVALSCAHMTAGSVALGTNFPSAGVNGLTIVPTRFEGSAMLTSARIEGDLECEGSHFLNGPKGNALIAEGCKIGGNVQLCRAYVYVHNDGDQDGEQTIIESRFRAEGRVSLDQSTVGGSVNCTGGSFKCAGDYTLSLVRTQIAGNVNMAYGFAAEGLVRLDNAAIVGNLEASEGTFSNPDGVCLSFTGASFGGDVNLCHGFQSHGAVECLRARIGGYFYCKHGHFSNADNTALAANRITVANHVFLSEGFIADGPVALTGATVGGDVNLGGGIFRLSAGQRTRLEESLYLGRARVDGILWFGARTTDSEGRLALHGPISLYGTHVRRLFLNPDDLPHLPPPEGQRNAKSVPQSVELDGFTYDHLEVGGGHEPVAAMKALLRRQPKTHLVADFRPQPFEQAIATFRKMGREDEAKAIARMKSATQRHRNIDLLRGNVRRSYAEGAGRWLAAAAILMLLLTPLLWFDNALLRTLHTAIGPDLAGLLGWAHLAALAATLLPLARIAVRGLSVLGLWLGYDVLLGAGYARSRPLILYAALLALGGWVYAQAAEQGAFVPVSQQFLVNPEVRTACAGRPVALSEPINWTRCTREPHGLNHFRPYWYSLDLMLQFGPLGQRRDWEPASDPVRLDVPIYGAVPLGPNMLKTFSWVQSIAALALYALLLGAVTGLIKKE